jgi:hypothetical protein
MHELVRFRRRAHTHHMTERWVYVGDLGPDGSLNWGGDNTDNTPTTGPDLPLLFGSAFWVIMRLAKEGHYEGKSVDWGAWALKVNGPQLREVLEAIYGSDPGWQSWPTVVPYIAFAEQLGADQYVAFVAAEL